MDIGKSFSYPFEDNQWISKLGLGALIAMVPLLNIAWSGYLVQLTRNVMNNVQEPLPTWDDIDKKFMDGLLLVVAGLAYSLPLMLVVCLPMGVMVIPALLSSGSSDMQSIAEVIAGAGGVLFLCLLCVFGVYGIVLSVIYPAILVLYAREGTLASCFKFREVFDMIGKNTGNFFTAWGVGFGAALGINLVMGVVQGVLSLIPCVGWILGFVLAIGVIIYTPVVTTHLFGQFGRSVFGPNEVLLPDPS